MRSTLSRISLITLLVLSLSGIADAQSSCPPSSGSGTVAPNVTLTVDFCVLTTDSVIGAYAYGLPSGKTVLSNVVVIAGPFSDGMTQLRGTIPGQPVGTYNVTITGVNLSNPSDPNSVQEGTAQSSPFVLTVAPAPKAKPGAPARVNIHQ